MRREKSQIEWLEFDFLLPFKTVIGKTFLRHGGVSRKPFDSLNLSNQIGDVIENVRTNRQLLREHLGVKEVVFAKQTHSDLITRVSKNQAAKEADGLFTQEKGIALAVTHADCQACIFYDPERHVVAVVHAGWRGLVKKIYQNCVQTLARECKTKPNNLIVCISPSIGPDHAEFKNYREEFPKEFWDFQVKENFFDLREIGKKQILETGVQEKNIEIADVCTFCDKQDYFSFRRDKKTGRHATVACLL